VALSWTYRTAWLFHNFLYSLKALGRLFKLSLDEIEQKLRLTRNSTDQSGPCELFKEWITLPSG